MFDIDNSSKTENNGVGTWERTDDPNLEHKVKCFYSYFYEVKDFIEQNKVIPIKISGVGYKAFVLEYVDG